MRCEVYGQAGQQNLTVRKRVPSGRGKDQIRYLRCQVCGAEFSEQKQTALWNTKVSEAKAVAVAEHLAEGCSLKATARLVRVDASTDGDPTSAFASHVFWRMCNSSSIVLAVV